MVHGQPHDLDGLRQIGERERGIGFPIVPVAEAALQIDATELATIALIEPHRGRVACPKVGCGQPAILRCAAAGNSKIGVFQFDHSIDGKRTSHLGTSALPTLHFVAAPADRRRNKRPN